jgi:anti-sigma-K factor RskA
LATDHFLSQIRFSSVKSTRKNSRDGDKTHLTSYKYVAILWYVVSPLPAEIKQRMTLHEQVAQDLPLYALGTLTDDDRRSVEEHLRECSRCRFELHLLREDMNRLSLNGPELADFEEHHVVRNLAPMITLDSQPTTPVHPSRLYWLVAIPIVLCVVFGAMLTQLRSQNSELNQQNAVSLAELNSERARGDHARMVDSILHDSATAHFAVTGSPIQLQVMFHPAQRRAVAISSHMPRPQASKVYQLWMIPVSGSQAVSAGTFIPDANGNVFLLSPQLPADVQFAGFEITVEDQGGSPAPTGNPIYTGK